MVFVFIWLPKLGAGNIGHGSMQVGSTYVSNWPGSLASALTYGAGLAATDFNSDKAAEGGMPEIIFTLKGLQEGDMRDKWADLKKDLKYSFEFKNCFETVAEVLCEGLTFVQSLMVPVPAGSVLVHAMLVTYVHNISLALGQGIPRNMMTGKNVFEDAWDKVPGNRIVNPLLAPGLIMG